MNMGTRSRQVIVAAPLALQEKYQMEIPIRPSQNNRYCISEVVNVLTYRVYFIAV